MSYSQMMHGLKAAGVEIDRKMLSDIAVKDAAGFTRWPSRQRLAGAQKPRRNVEKSCVQARKLSAADTN